MNEMNPLNPSELSRYFADLRVQATCELERESIDTLADLVKSMVYGVGGLMALGFDTYEAEQKVIYEAICSILGKAAA